MIGLTVACAVACAVLVVAEYRGLRGLRVAAKLLASAAFVAVAFSARRGPLEDPALGYCLGIAIGMLYGALGDVCLLGASRRAFLGGLVCFLLGHLAYLAGISVLVPPDRWLGDAGASAALPIGVAAVMLARLWPRLGSMRLPVIGYVVTITAMVVAAIAAWHGDALPAANRGRLVAGACLFFASDIAVARDRFLARRFSNKLWGLPAYYAGQLLFAWSLAGL